MISAIAIWTWFRGSLIAQIAAGCVAFLAAWKINNVIVARSTVKQVVAEAKAQGKARNEKVRNIRRSTPTAGAWDRLRSEYGAD